ncbi:nicotinate-nucleotide--dimethylbenzimidazole phosphoribosyltransferase [Flammeovirgaceae bacterium SG7u.111]|nr:nicotinate-nucleotide--dimethylbenzimidazole phosphoribosyltransferase [Flammeovirgaceae bacterium SG7u.132]WPO34572.1 nicotinate-nucleotide--dimethylbenzimidazole phosphoribosyltransferase [Flammeovirgaceae bacterium SG7u.111]
MREFLINKPDQALLPKIQHKIDFKTKPLGALGELETLAKKVCLVQNTLSPELKKPNMVVFAADHGVAAEGVSLFPQEVTFQMVMNFLAGGAAINVFCRQHGIEMKVVDAGVKFDFEKNDLLIDTKIAQGTASFMQGPSMSQAQCEEAIDKGAEVVENIAGEGCNIIGFGEMGIGNTTAASALLSAFVGISPEESVGRGTGVDDAGLQRKINALKKAFEVNEINPSNPVDTLAKVGGFEIAQMTGAMLQAASMGMVILVDGFIATSAFLTAYQINPLVKDFAVFCHHSDEGGHAKMLKYMDVRAILHLSLRLGEGTGAALAYPLVQSAVNFVNEMSSFEDAGVSDEGVKG